jgi:toxin FitB
VTAWLLDTNVLSELRRPRPESKVVTFVAAQKLDLLFVSDVTFAEIRFGIEQFTDPARRCRAIEGRRPLSTRASFHAWLIMS